MRRNLIVILVAVVGLTLAFFLWPKQEAGHKVSEPIGLATVPTEDAVVTNESPASGRASEAEPGVKAIRSKVESTDDGDVFVVVFPGGELIRARKHRPALPPMIRSAERLADVYESVRDRAEAGDMDAALALGEALRTCRSAAPSQKALNVAIDELYQTRQYRQFESDIKVQIDPSIEMDRLENSMRSQFTFCDGISQAQIAEVDHWTEQAAEQGSRLAKQRVLSDNAASERGFELAQELWQSGNVDGLGWLTHYYGGTYGEDVVAPDRVASYAYLYLWMQFDIATTPEKLSVKAELNREVLDELAARGAALSPREYDAAISLAKSLLRENENCCVAW